jgi:eukaryotic-like serine/threonine-protein kinase
MGEVFAGRYELVDPIGRGGVGAVWRAWDHRRRRYVAAKVLQQRDAHALLRFVREQALRIDHPHVLAPASWAADDDQVLFTMDLVAGGSLARLVGDYGPLPASYVCVLLDQLLSGLSAVHGEGVVHRDVKPANVLLEATGTGRPRLRLSDFGIAMRLGEPRLTDTNLVVGTPGYIAPEQLLGHDPDFPADLFAVGLVALYLLEGAKPDVKALLRHFGEHGTPGPPQGVPEPLWQVVASLVQPDPVHRFRTATGARKALAAAVELLPAPGPDDEQIEIFDQLGPLPPGFVPQGPLKRAAGVETRGTGAGSGAGAGADSGRGAGGRGAGPASASASASASGGAGPGGDAGGGAGTGTGGTPDPRRSAVPPSGPNGSAARPVNGSTGSVSMSDTGSFHLPPPQGPPAAPPAPRHPPAPPLPPPPGSTGSRTPAPGAPAPGAAAPGAAVGPTDSGASTGSTGSVGSLGSVGSAGSVGSVGSSGTAPTTAYTAHAPLLPAPPPGPVPGPSPASAAPTQARHRAARRRRSGPPAKVAIPLLLLALVCYAVGFWALSRL